MVRERGEGMLRMAPYQVAEVHRQHLSIAGDFLEEKIEQFEGMTVHPLVMDHDAATSRGEAFFDFSQQRGKRLERIALFAGVQVNVYLKIGEGRQGCRTGAETSRHRKKAEIGEGLEGGFAASVPRRSEHRQKILGEELLEPPSTLGKAAPDDLRRAGRTEFLLFPLSFKIAVYLTVLMPAPLAGGGPGHLAEFGKALVGEPGGDGCQTEGEGMFLKTANELGKAQRGDADIIGPEKY